MTDSEKTRIALLEQAVSRLEEGQRHTESLDLKVLKRDVDQNQETLARIAKIGWGLIAAMASLLADKYLDLL